MEIDNTERMDKIQFFVIVCKKSNENWFGVGMLIKKNLAEIAGEHPVLSVRMRMPLRRYVLKGIENFERHLNSWLILELFL